MHDDQVKVSELKTENMDGLREDREKSIGETTALRTGLTAGSASTADTSTRFTPSRAFSKAMLDRSESSNSNNSVEEAHQCCCRQLLDDITPDFKVMRKNETRALGGSLLGWFIFT